MPLSPIIRIPFNIRAQKLERDVQQGEVQQREVLARLVRTARDTEFGKAREMVCQVVGHDQRQV